MSHAGADEKRLRETLSRIGKKYMVLSGKGGVGKSTDDVIVPTAGSCGEVKERMDGKTDMTCYDWFFCTEKLDKEKVMSTILKK